MAKTYVPETKQTKLTEFERQELEKQGKLDKDGNIIKEEMTEQSPTKRGGELLKKVISGGKKPLPQEGKVLTDRDIKDLNGQTIDLNEVYGASDEESVSPKETIQDKSEEINETESVKLCPRCKWDVAQEYKLEVTADLKQDFIRAVLGNKRFIMDRAVFDGTVFLKFRTRTTRENKIIAQALSNKIKAGDIVELAQISNSISRWNLLASLVSINLNGEHNEEKATLDSLTEGLSISDAANKIAELAEQFELTFTGPIYHILVNEQSAFDIAVAGLEAMATASDFWKKTDG